MAIKTKCSCNEEKEIIINTLEEFLYYKNFFENKTVEKVFLDLSDYNSIWHGDGGEEKNYKVRTIKHYKCKECGSIWEFIYPRTDFDGKINKFQFEKIE